MTIPRYRYITFLIVALTAMIASPPYTEAQTRRSSSRTSTAATQKKNSSAKADKKSNSSSKGKRGKRNSTSKDKGETSADVKKKQEATQNEIRQTKEQIEANKQKVQKELGELSRISSDVEISAKKVSQLDSKVSTLSSRISSLEKSIAEGEAEVARMRAEYLKAVKKMRLTTRNSSPLAFIFSAESFNQGLRRMRYMREFSSWKENRSKEINRKTSLLRQEAESLEKARTEQREALQKQRVAKNQLEARRKEQNEIVARLKSEGQALNAHLSQKQAEANQLKARIAELIAVEQRKAAEEARKRQEAEAAKARAEAERKAKQEAAAKEAAAKTAADKEAAAKKSNKKEQPKKEKPKKETPKKEQTKKGQQAKASSGTGFASMKGSLPRPVEGHFRISSPFGRHALPELPDVVYDNPGIDIEVSAGSTAKAVYAGTVSGVYMIPGFGNVVILSHGNYYTVYGNLSSVSVKSGEEIRQGQAVGRVATDDDNPKFGSLHFEVWRNRDKLDPAGWIK